MVLRREEKRREESQENDKVLSLDDMKEHGMINRGQRKKKTNCGWGDDQISVGILSLRCQLASR